MHVSARELPVICLKPQSKPQEQTHEATGRSPMNEYQTKLWNDLMALTESNEAFYYTDSKEQFGSAWYRIFNYRLASYSDFCLPNALECRGHMFEITQQGKDASPLRLAALPPEKFFNLHENPFTIDLDLSQVDAIEDKADGSLISTFEHSSQVCLKSKASLTGSQATDAHRYLMAGRP